MNKFSFLLALFAVVLMAACDNQNAVTDGDASGESTEMSADSAKAKVQQMREPKSTTKNTAGQQKASRPTSYRLEDNSRNVFSGEFAYMADAAYFINCSTDSKYSVLMEDAFPELEKAYLKAVGENAGTRAYAVLEGEMQPKPAGDESHFRGALKVTKVHSVNAEKNCNSVIFKVGGMYSSFEGEAVIKDCKTGKVYAVLADDSSKMIEAAYKELMEEGKSVYAEMMGFRQPVPAEEGGSMKTGIAVTRFIGFDQSYSCE